MNSWQKEKKTIVSNSNCEKKKTFLPSSHDIFHPYTRKKCICGAPCCDQPIFSFVFHLLPRHRRVPLSKWRCCNEPKLLLINEKASSCAATVRSSASEPRATIHACEPANFASSHSVTVPWHILSRGHGYCLLIFKQAFLQCFWICRGLLCLYMPSLPGCGKAIALVGLSTFSCSASYDPILVLKSTSDWHEE